MSEPKEIVTCPCGKVLTLDSLVPVGSARVISERGEFCSMRCADEAERGAPALPAEGAS